MSILLTRRKWKQRLTQTLLGLIGMLLLIFPIRMFVVNNQIPSPLQYTEKLNATQNSWPTEASVNQTVQVDSDHLVETHGSSFCVIPNFIKPSKTPILKNTITYASYGTLHYVKYLRLIADRWAGPISYSLYMLDVKEESLKKAWTHLKGYLGCSGDLKDKLYVHILFRSRGGSCRVSALLNQHLWSDKNGEKNERGICPKDVEGTESTKIRDFHGISYPYNTNRNVARSYALTDLVMVADAELVPCKDFVQLFMEFYSQAEPEKMVVWVVPVFEIDAESEYPTDKRSLVDLYKSNAAVPFHHNYFGFAHIIPDMDKWIEREADPVTATLHAATKYLGRQWEPTCIMRRTVPAYDENFIGFGKCKASQTLELCCADYTFNVMDGVFLTHSGIKFEGVRSPAAYTALKINSIYLSTKFLAGMRTKYECKTIDHCVDRCNCTINIPPV